MKTGDVLTRFKKADDEGYGYWPTSALKLAGLATRDIRTLLDAGVIERVRRGIYVSTTADDAVKIAGRLNGRVGCLTGARMHQLWTPNHPHTHVILKEGRNNVRHGRDVMAHWARKLPEAVIYSPQACVEHVVHFHDSETGLVVLESAFNRHVLSARDAQMLVALQPEERRKVLRFFTPGSQSGTETRVRLLLQRHGLDVLPQVAIPGVGRVDLLVRGRVIIELDSRAHHLPVEQYHEDRRRDFTSVSKGFTVIRLTWEQVWLPKQWGTTRRRLLDFFGVKCRRAGCCQAAAVANSKETSC